MALPNASYSFGWMPRNILYSLNERKLNHACAHIGEFWNLKQMALHLWLLHANKYAPNSLTVWLSVPTEKKNIQHAVYTVCGVLSYFSSIVLEQQMTG